LNVDASRLSLLSEIIEETGDCCAPVRPLRFPDQTPEKAFFTAESLKLFNDEEEERVCLLVGVTGADEGELEMGASGNDSLGPCPWP
jgi:hypothetical protein